MADSCGAQIKHNAKTTQHYTLQHDMLQHVTMASSPCFSARTFILHHTVSAALSFIYQSGGAHVPRSHSDGDGASGPTSVPMLVRLQTAARTRMQEALRLLYKTGGTWLLLDGRRRWHLPRMQPKSRGTQAK